MTRPRISVIIVLYNALDRAERCLESLAPQAGPELEVVAVDNASTEPGLERLAERFGWLRLIRNSGNTGFARAVNQAARVARGDYLLLLNPDCLVPESVPARLADWLDAHPSAGLAGPRLANSDGSLQTSAYAFPSLLQTAVHMFDLKRLLPLAALRRLAPAGLGRRIGQLDRHQSDRPVDYLTGAAVMIRRTVWDSLDGLDERFFLYYEEIDFCLRAQKAGWSTWLLPRLEVGHHIGASSDTAPRIATLARYDSLIAYFHKHRPAADWLVRGLVRTGAAWRHGLAGLRGAGEEARTWRLVHSRAGRRDAPPRLDDSR